MPQKRRGQSGTVLPRYDFAYNRRLTLTRGGKGRKSLTIFSGLINTQKVKVIKVKKLIF
jgi:hypothetical protein